MIKRIIIILLALTSPLTGGLGGIFAQKDDIGLWLGANVTKKVSKKWNVGAGLEYRMKDNISTTDRFSGTVTIGFKPTKWLKADAGYTYLHGREAGGYTKNGKYYRSTYWFPRHRAFLGVTGLWKISKRFRLSLRERWVYTYKPSYDVNRINVNKYSTNYGVISSKEEEGSAENILRSKLTLDYNIKKCPVSPFASVEMYNAWNVQKVRYSIGASYDINKHNSLKAYYLFQDYNQSVTGDDNIDRHVFGIDYGYSF